LGYGWQIARYGPKRPVRLPVQLRSGTRQSRSMIREECPRRSYRAGKRRGRSYRNCGRAAALHRSCSHSRNFPGSRRVRIPVLADSPPEPVLPALSPAHPLLLRPSSCCNIIICIYMLSTIMQYVIRYRPGKGPVYRGRLLLYQKDIPLYLGA
jgi:hypothetical protein